MQRLLRSIARRVWPGLDALPPTNRRIGLMTLASVLYAAPLALGGLVWLALSLDVAAIRSAWLPLLGLLAFSLLFKLFYFFLNVEILPGVYATTNTTLDIVTWSGALLFGPAAIAIDMATLLAVTAARWRAEDAMERWGRAQQLAFALGAGTLPRMVALALYLRWGGVIPLPGLQAEALLPALLATLVALALSVLVQLPILALFVDAASQLTPGVSPLRLVGRALLVVLSISAVLDPVSVFVAGLYHHSGGGVYFFFAAMMLAASVVVSRFSHATERTRQRSRELEQIEQLGRALLEAPLDGSALPDVLAEYMPGMFSYCRVEVHLFPDISLARVPESWQGAGAEAWNWLRAHPGQHTFRWKSIPPWGGEPLQRHVLLLPIAPAEGGEPIGGLYVARSPETGSIDDLVPAAQTLAAQIASALQQAEVYQRTLEHERQARELAVAGQIQASFLPAELPQIEGWQVATALEPARETSGDFYDLIAMWDGRLGIVVADVADKGVGAALFMALTRTLIRTYAVEYSTRYPDTYAFHPERVLDTVNQCIIQDTRSDLFVTVFFGIIDPQHGMLTYASAGHNPPLLFSAVSDKEPPRVERLTRTGIPLGMLPEARWERGSVRFAPGDVLVVYTDGVTEAENHRQDYYGEHRLIRTVAAHAARPAEAIQRAVVEDVRAFVGGAPVLDDLTLLVVRREKAAWKGESEK